MKTPYAIYSTLVDAFEACVNMEKEVMSKLKRAEANKRQQELRESAATFLSDEERAETAKLVRL